MALLYPDVPESVEVEQDNTTQEPPPCLCPPDHFLLIFQRADKLPGHSHSIKPTYYFHSMPRKSHLISFMNEECSNIEYLFMTVIFTFQYNKNTHIPQALNPV